MKKYLRRRLDQLDAKGYATLSTVLIEFELCSTRADYERAFEKAWSRVPAGAIVYCWMRRLADHEFTAIVEGRLVQPHVMGIYLKPQVSNHLFGPRRQARPRSQRLEGRRT